MVTCIRWPGAEFVVRDRPLEVTQVWVAGQHAEAFGEYLDIVEVEEVVAGSKSQRDRSNVAMQPGLNSRKHSSDLVNQDGGAIVVGEVQRRRPVRGLVLRHGTGRARARIQVLVVDIETKV